MKYIFLKQSKLSNYDENMDADWKLCSPGDGIISCTVERVQWRHLVPDPGIISVLKTRTHMDI